MANWCENVVTITAKDEETARAFFEAMQDGDPYEGVPNPICTMDGDAATRGDANMAEWVDDNRVMEGRMWLRGREVEMSWASRWEAPIAFFKAMHGAGFGVRAAYFEPGMCFCGTWQDGAWNNVEFDGDRSLIPAEVEAEYRPVRTALRDRNVWIDRWALPILDIPSFSAAIIDEEDELLDLWLEERRTKQAADEALFRDVPDLLAQLRAQAAEAMKRDAEQRVREEFTAIPAGAMNANLYRLAKWLVCAGHGADEMHAILSGLLMGRAGGREHMSDLKDIRDDVVRGRMRKSG